MIQESRMTSRGGYLARTLTGTLLAVAGLSVLAGCSTYDSLTQRIAQSITPYRITIVQGNFISKETAAQMRVGMSRAEVRQLLGTPLLTDIFHADRWDYIFYFKRGSKSVVQQRDFVVLFQGNNVVSWSGGDDLPSNLELLAEIDGDRTGKKVKKVAASAPAASSPDISGGTTAAQAAIGPTVSDPVRTTSAELGAATSALPVDPNAQAASAANRATTAVRAPTGRITPSVRENTPPSAGLPPNVGTMPQQLQLQRSAQPQAGASSNPVGPTTGSPGTGTSEPVNPPRDSPLSVPPQ